MDILAIARTRTNISYNITTENHAIKKETISTGTQSITAADCLY